MLPPCSSKKINASIILYLICATISIILLSVHATSEWSDNSYIYTTSTGKQITINPGISIVLFNGFNICFMFFNARLTYLSKYQDKEDENNKCRAATFKWFSAASFCGMMLTSILSFIFSCLNSVECYTISTPLYVVALIPLHLIFSIFALYFLWVLLYACGFSICTINLNITSQGVDVTSYRV